MTAQRIPHWRIARHWPFSVIAWLLLAFAIASTALWAVSAMRARAMRIEARADRASALLHASRRMRTRSSAVRDPAAAQSWNEQMHLLNRDWPRLTVALVPPNPAIRLLAVDINPASGLVRIEGEAPAAVAANAYVQALSNRGVFRDVRLIEVRENGGGTHFEARGVWTD